METPYIAANRWLRSMLSWQPTNTSATVDQQKGYQDTLIARCRDAWRNQPVAHAIIERLENLVIGSGLVLKANKEIEKNWEKWIEKCEYEDTQNFYSLQRLVFKSQLIAGDVFINTLIINNNLLLQIVEAERVSNPNLSPDVKNLIQGVYFENEKPVAYYIQTSHPGDMFPEYTWIKLYKYGPITGLKRVFHVWKKERPGQVRGIPILVNTLEPLRQLDRYLEAELTGAVVSNLFSTFITSEGGMSLPTSTDSTQETASLTENADRIYLEPGAVINLLPGEKVDFANPSKPNPNFDIFVKSIIRLVGASVGIPYDLLMLQFDASYSASRASIMQAWKMIKNYRWFIIEQFCKPVYDLWLYSEIEAGRLPATSIDVPISWIGPARGSIDDTKEIIAARERIKLGVSSIRDEAEELLEKDYKEVLNQQSIEKKLKEELGIVDQGGNIETPITMEGKENAI